MYSASIICVFTFCSRVQFLFFLFIYVSLRQACLVLSPIDFSTFFFLSSSLFFLPAYLFFSRTSRFLLSFSLFLLGSFLDSSLFLRQGTIVFHSSGHFLPVLLQVSESNFSASLIFLRTSEGCPRRDIFVKKVIFHFPFAEQNSQMPFIHFVLDRKVRNLIFFRVVELCLRLIPHSDLSFSFIWSNFVFSSAVIVHSLHMIFCSSLLSLWRRNYNY